MSITLGAHTFDPSATVVAEEHREVAGQDARVIRIKGVLAGLESEQALEAALDTLLAAASTEVGETPLSIRPGRVLHVRRTGFKREINRAALTAAYTLELAAESPFEIDENPTIRPWPIAVSGSTITINALGNTPAPANIVLQATGVLIDPSFTDGHRVITYHGSLAIGDVVEFDGIAQRVRRLGEDLTPYATGDFPRIGPGTTTLTYSDAPASAHAAFVAVWYRNRWW